MNEPYDSASRKLTRCYYWSRIYKDLLGLLGDGPHLVPAARGGSDIATMLGMGISAKSIIAVDSDPESAYMALERFPNVKVICGDVRQVVKENRRKFHSAFLDLDNSVGEDTIETLLQVVLHGLRDDAILGFSFMPKDDEFPLDFDPTLARLMAMPENAGTSSISRNLLGMLGRLHQKTLLHRCFLWPRNIYRCVDPDRPNERNTITVMAEFVRDRSKSKQRAFLHSYTEFLGAGPAPRIHVVEASMENLRQHVIELHRHAERELDVEIVAHDFNLPPTTIEQWIREAVIQENV